MPLAELDLCPMTFTQWLGVDVWGVGFVACDRDCTGAAITDAFISIHALLFALRVLRLGGAAGPLAEPNDLGERLDIVESGGDPPERNQLDGRQPPRIGGKACTRAEGHAGHDDEFVLQLHRSPPANADAADTTAAARILSRLMDLPFEPMPACATTRTTVSALRLGDHLLLTLPGEPHVELVDRIRASSPIAGERTLVVGHAQDHMGYAMSVEDWLARGYEPSINVWGPLEGELIAERLVELELRGVQVALLPVEVREPQPQVREVRAEQHGLAQLVLQRAPRDDSAPAAPASATGDFCLS